MSPVQSFVFGLDGGDEELTEPPLTFETITNGKLLGKAFSFPSFFFLLLLLLSIVPGSAKVLQKQILSQVPLKPCVLSLPLQPSGSLSLVLTLVGSGASGFALPYEPIPLPTVRVLNTP